MYFPEVLQQKAIEGGALDVVEQYLQHYQLEEGLCNMVLVTIGSLTDSGKDIKEYRIYLAMRWGFPSLE